MTPEVWHGLGMACICFGSPTLAGFLAGWWLHGRYLRLGPWALLPGFVKRLYGYIQEIREEALQTQNDR